jgi:hypothetical protein
MLEYTILIEGGTVKKKRRNFTLCFIVFLLYGDLKSDLTQKNNGESTSTPVIPGNWPVSLSFDQLGWEAPDSIPGISNIQNEHHISVSYTFDLVSEDGHHPSGTFNTSRVIQYILLQSHYDFFPRNVLWDITKLYSPRGGFRALLVQTLSQPQRSFPGAECSPSLIHAVPSGKTNCPCIMGQAVDNSPYPGAVRATECIPQAAHRTDLQGHQLAANSGSRATDVTP